MTVQFRGQAIESAKPNAGLRGQAMMEYLVTYGWALLALFLVIALLIASGVFSPNSFSSQDCTFQPNLPCSPYILYVDTTPGPTNGQAILNFTLTNGLGFPINVTGVNYTTTDLGLEGRNLVVGSFPGPVALLPGGNISFGQNFSGTREPSPKTFKTLYATVSYLNCKNPPGCTGPYIVSGRISAMVEQS